MENEQLGCIKDYDWHNGNIYLLRTCIQQTILSYIQLFIIYGFLHQDFHPNNIILKTTTSKYIDYDITGIGKFEILSNGIMPWISGFDKIVKSTSIVDFYFGIKTFLIYFQHELHQKNMYLTFCPLDMYINELCMKGLMVNYDELQKILDLIDKIDVKVKTLFIVSK